MSGWIVVLVVGALAGWLAGTLMKGRGFGLLGNLVVGIIGAFLGSHLFAALGVHLASGLLGSLITAVIGAMVLLFVVGLIKKA